MPALVDWDFWAKNVKFTAALVRGLAAGGGAAKGLLPYSLKTQADDLGASVDSATLLTAGADSAAVTRISTDIAALKTAANAYESAKSTTPISKVDQVNTALLQAIKVLDTPLMGFTQALSVRYNHQVVLADLQYLNSAIAVLQTDATDSGGQAFTFLTWMNWQWYMQFFDHATSTEFLVMQDPTYARLYAGALGHPATPLDLWTPMHQVKAHDGATALPALVTAQAQLRTSLNTSLNRTSAAIERALVIWNDKTPPVTKAKGNDSHWHKSGAKWSITLSAVDNPGGSGIATREYSVDSAHGPWTKCGAKVKLNPGAFADGQHTFYYRSLDVAGNASTTKSFTFKVDRHGLQTFSVDKSNAVHRNHVVTLRYRVIDTGSSMVNVEIQITNGQGQTVAVWKVGKVAIGWMKSYNHRVTLAHGTYTCRFKATGKAGKAQSRIGQTRLIVH